MIRRRSVRVDVEIDIADVLGEMTENMAREIAEEFDLVVVEEGLLDRLREAAVDGDIAEFDRLVMRRGKPRTLILPKNPDPNREIAIMPGRPL